MRKARTITTLVVCLAPLTAVFSQTSKTNAAYVESMDLGIVRMAPALTAASLSPQQNPEEGRGLILPLLAGYLINKGVAGVQKMIDDRKNRFITSYNFSQRDQYFYSDISTTSSSDLVGLQFEGFRIVRLAKKLAGQPADTLFYAKFVLDTTNGRLSEMANNGIFHLKLDSIRVSKARVAAPKNVRKLSLDFEITFQSSYRTADGQLYTDAPLGKFIFSLRDAPLYTPSDPESVAYYADLEKRKPLLTGESFLVPRSAGHYKNPQGIVNDCWGQGLYSVNVSVKECSKEKFVDKLIVFTSGPALNIAPAVLQKAASNLSK
ncbi:MULTISPECIES: hypothetical protein [Chitinophagaceae]